jgi:cell division protein FtsB
MGELDRAKKVLMAVGIGAGLVWLYGPALLRWVELKSRQAQLEADIRHWTEENRRLMEEARRLREDISYAESVARSQFKLVRPGETKITFRQAAEE